MADVFASLPKQWSALIAENKDFLTRVMPMITIIQLFQMQFIKIQPDGAVSRKVTLKDLHNFKSKSTSILSF